MSTSSNPINVRISSFFISKPNIYRIATAFALLLVIILALIVPVRLTEPDDWAYYYAARNFSQGRLVIDDQLHSQQVAEANQQGGQLGQYVRIGPDRWALEKAPGTVFFMVPFELLRIPKAANILLIILGAFITYLLLRRLRDEYAAFIGTTLLLVTPLALTMLYRSYMDTLSGSAFLFIGGGLYIYLMIRQAELKPLFKGLLLFLAFLLISWSVVSRYTNLPIAAAFALHYCITRIMMLSRHKSKAVLGEIVPVVLGIGIPMAVLLIYHTVVFGSPFNYGYNYTKGDITFAFQHLGQTDAQGNSIPLQTVIGNLRNMPSSLLIGLPLLAVAIPGILVLLYQKSYAFFVKARNDEWPEIKWNILFLLISWIVLVFPLYMLYEWTSPLSMENTSFFIKARFYLPGLFPLVILVALVMSRWAKQLVAGLLILSIVAGVFVSLNATTIGPAKQPVQQPAPSGIQQPAVPPQPGQTGPQEFINRIRQEVKGSPTNKQNLQPRFQALTLWTLSLSNQGFPVAQVVPMDRIWRIQNMINAGNINDASKNIDQAFKDLENLVSKKQ